MLPRTYDEITCSIARTLEIVGDRWTLLVVRDALIGTTRFDRFQASLGIASNTLADRLARLVDVGVLEKLPSVDRPDRSDYRPTDKGRELWFVLAAMMDWGDRYYAPDGPPRLLQHRECGHSIVERLTCAQCGRPVPVDQINTVPGPGRSGPTPAHGARSGPALDAALGTGEGRLREEGSKP